MSQNYNRQPNMAGGYVSPKKKAVMLLLTIFGFHLGLQYFYAGLTKKGVLFLLLYWPCFVLGWILLIFMVGWALFAIQVVLMIIAIGDLIKLVKGNMLDGKGLPIVN